jgi:hypothetical protein
MLQFYTVENIYVIILSMLVIQVISYIYMAQFKLNILLTIHTFCQFSQFLVE